jgi:AcrR family transcriptional regulator
VSGWLRGEQAGLAIDRILDAAGAEFLAMGISDTGMADIARAAGCSRATLYRYFDNRDALRLAYVNREAARVAASVGGAVAAIDDPAERLAAAVLGAIDQVRRTPSLAAWFTPSDLGIANRVAASSEVVGALASGLLGDAHHVSEARWLVRVIVSLLGVPGRDADEERELVERFVVPCVLEAVAPGARIG